MRNYGVEEKTNGQVPIGTKSSVHIGKSMLVHDGMTSVGFPISTNVIV